MHLLEGIIYGFIDESPENTLGNRMNDKAWAEPLIGFSAGNGTLCEFFKSNIGNFYWTPLEIFLKTFPSSNARANQLTVISWILPQTEITKADNTVVCHVLITILCDINGDHVVGMADISLLIEYFLKEPDSLQWNPNPDVNCDNIIDMADISIAITNFLESWGACRRTRW
jgi:hypothetical protein